MVNMTNTSVPEVLSEMFKANSYITNEKYEEFKKDSLTQDEPEVFLTYKLINHISEKDLKLVISTLKKHNI